MVNAHEKVPRRGRPSPRPAVTHLGSRHSPRPAITRGPSHSGSPRPESLAAASDCSLFQARPESLISPDSLRLTLTTKPLVRINCSEKAVYDSSYFATCNRFFELRSWY